MNAIICNIKLRETAVTFVFSFSAVFKNDVLGEDIQAPSKEIIQLQTT
jgi:hypothetical protein